MGLTRIAIALTLFATQIASAQTEDLMTQAREAADAGRLVEARDLLIQLIQTDPSPEAAANLAMVRRGLGELLESQRLLERLVAGELGALDPQRQEQATQLLREVRSEVASITVVLRGAPAGTAVRLDGRDVGTTNAEHRLTLACDPGRHLVRAMVDGRAVEREIDVGMGGAATVELSFEVEVEVPTPREVATDPVNEPIVLPEPSNGVAIGLGIGAAVVAVVVAVVLAIVLGGAADLPARPESYLGTSTL